MKKRTIFGLLATSTSIMLFSGVAGAQPVDVANGKERYEETCIACHGGNGKGAFAGMPDLTRKNGPFSKSDAELLQTVTDGLDRPEAEMAMPPQGGNPDLTESDIKDILAYMRRSFKWK